MGSKSISTLVEDIENLFDGHKFDLDNLSKFSSTIEYVLLNRFQEYGEGRKPTLRLSNVGKPLRQLWFEVASGLKGEKLSPSTKIKFLYGDLIEAIMIALAIEAGHTVTDLQKEVELDGIKGHIDCVIDGVLVDIKSASTFSFRKFQDRSLLGNDPFGYIAQLSGYSCAMGNLDAAFLAIDKTLGHLCLCQFSKEELKEYDVRTRIAEAKAVVGRDKPPEDLCYVPISEGSSGNLKLPVGCSYCSFKYACHPTIRTFLYASGPVYLTKVVKTPKVFEVTNRKETDNVQ